MSARDVRRALLCALVCALCSVALVGCASGDAEGARSALEAQLSQLAGAGDNAEELLGDSATDFDKLGISGSEFLGAFFDGFSYEIGEVSVDGDAANAEVRLTTRSLSAVVDAFEESYTEKSFEAGVYPDEDEMYLKAGEALLECLRAAKLDEVTCEVGLAYKDGVWSVSDEGKSALISALGVS